MIKQAFKSLVAVSALVGAGVALAADPVATVVDLSGIVTVSQGSTMGNAVKGTELAPGAQVATAASSTAVIRYKKGCDVKLEANQALKIDESNACGAIVAGGAIEPAWAAAGIGAAILLMPKTHTSAK
jgi:hypothetical protein